MAQLVSINVRCRCVPARHALVCSRSDGVPQTPPFLSQVKTPMRTLCSWRTFQFTLPGEGSAHQAALLGDAICRPPESNRGQAKDGDSLQTPSGSMISCKRTPAKSSNSICALKHGALRIDSLLGICLPSGVKPGSTVAGKASGVYYLWDQAVWGAGMFSLSRRRLRECIEKTSPLSLKSLGCLTERPERADGRA
jgi:hypothetical protein